MDGEYTRPYTKDEVDGDVEVDADPAPVADVAHRRNGELRGDGMLGVTSTA
jgi:hypothetical protein